MNSIDGPVLVTGASGFVGRALVARLALDGMSVRAGRHHAPTAEPAGVQAFGGLDLGAPTDWSAALHGARAVVHCAARVHVMRDTTADPLAEFRRVNVQGSLALASQAASEGVRRFVFVSSIGVNGAATTDRPFHADDAPAPHSPYAQSKLEAELALLALAEQTGLEVVIIRPPLVYGPDAPGNFGSLMNAVYRGIPLPFGSVKNQRSLIALDNLVDLLLRCVNHPAAAGQVFLASDGEDLSTPELLRRTAAALGRKAHLLPVPVALLRGASQVFGKAAMMQSLCASLQIDIEKTRSRLGWSPPVSPDQALASSAQRYLATRLQR